MSNDSTILQVRVDYIDPNPRQPRQAFDAAEIASLAESIREHGIIQPLTVAEIATDEGARWLLIAGERRLMAAKLAGLESVPVIVRQVAEGDFLELALIENVQRVDLNGIEKAKAYQQLIEKYGYTQDDVAAKVGKERATVSNTLRLLKLPQRVQERLCKGDISERQASALLQLFDLPQPLLERAETGNLGQDIRPSVIESRTLNGEASGVIRDLINRMIRGYGAVLQWKLSDVFAVPAGKPATCGECPARLQHVGVETCGDFACFSARLTAFRKQTMFDAAREPKGEGRGAGGEVKSAGERFREEMAGKMVDGGRLTVDGDDPAERLPDPRYERPEPETEPEEGEETESEPEVSQPVTAPTASPPPEPAPAPVVKPDWEHSTIVLTVTLMPMIGPGPRQAMVGLRANTDAPIIRMWRESDIQIGGAAADMMMQLKAKMEAGE